MPPVDETLSDCLKRIFPADNNAPYFDWPGRDGARKAPYEIPPLMPADVFAVAGYLLQYSGAYHHIVPEVAVNSGPSPS
jgi:hypothetical protein